MTLADKIFSRVVLGTIAPASLMLVGWWGSFGVLGDGPVIPYAAAGGLVLGIVLDVTLLRHRLDGVFDIRPAGLLAIAVFYSVMIYGFFMGFPVFNLAVGIAGGIVAGRAAALRHIDNATALTAARRNAWIATAILAALCAATAWLALAEPTICSEVRGMLALPFEVTMPMIYATILAGGSALLVADYFLTLLAARLAARRTVAAA